MTDLRLDAALLRDLEGFALGVASEAALLIAERAEAGVSATKSSPTDVVTEMDRRAQALIEERIAAYRPQDAFFGEEDGNRAGSSGITWVVDPIDGTVNYVYDIPAYAVSVAAVVGDPRTPGAWTPVAGAVVNPVSGERFWARAGGGASRQRGRLGATRIGVSTQRDLSLALIGTGFGYEPATRAWQARVLAPLPRRRRQSGRLLRARTEPVGHGGRLADRHGGRGHRERTGWGAGLTRPRDRGRGVRQRPEPPAAGDPRESRTASGPMKLPTTAPPGAAPGGLGIRSDRN